MVIQACPLFYAVGEIANDFFELNEAVGYGARGMFLKGLLGIILAAPILSKLILRGAWPPRLSSSNQLVTVAREGPDGCVNPVRVIVFARIVTQVH